MIPPYDGAPDPLPPGELQRRIANCDAVIDRLRSKGLTNYIAGWPRRKRQYLSATTGPVGRLGPYSAAGGGGAGWRR